MTEEERRNRLSEEVYQIEQLETGQGCPAEVIDSLCCRLGICVVVGIIIYACALAALIKAKNESEGCGIDVFFWLQVHLGLVLLGGILFLPVLCYLRYNHPAKALCMFLVIALILLIAIAAWIVYGYFIYFSDNNDCTNHKETSVGLVFMCIFLIFGLC